MDEFTKINYILDSPDYLIIVPVMCTAVFFILYWFVAQSVDIKKYFFDRYDFNVASTKYFFFIKFFGFFALGAVPVFICINVIQGITLAEIGLTLNYKTHIFTLVWIVILSAVCITATYFNARKPKNLINYPQLRANVWTTRTLIINLTGWGLYLLGYEVLFRGILLFPLYKTLGLWPAISVNIALYSLSHIPKGLSETIGAIPLSIVLCIVTLSAGTIWIAFWVHVAIAWTNSLVALKYHPTIQYISHGK